VRIRTKRVYEPAARQDGYRVLVDRVWPRGVKKEDAALDDWAKDVAPSPELRKWFAHDKSKWDEFKQRYWRELAGNSSVVERLMEEAGDSRVTLLYSAKDETHNNAVALKEYLEERPKG